MGEFWYDTRVGEMLVGDAAVSERLEQSGPGDIVPLAHLVTANPLEVRILTQNIKLDSPDSLIRTREDYIAYGHWILRLLEESDTSGLKEDHLENLYFMNIGPLFIGRFRSHFQTLYNYKREIGSPIGRSRGQFSGWATAEFVAYAQQIAKQLGRKPHESDYDQAFNSGEGPSMTMLRLHFGSKAELDEYLGYPDIRGWDEEDFIDWGVRALRANSESGLTRGVINALSRKNHGPSTSTVINRFGTLSGFQVKVEERLRQEDEDRQMTKLIKLERYRTMITNNTLPSSAANLSDDELLRVGAQRLIIERCAPDLNDSKKQHLALGSARRLVSELSRRYVRLTAGDIENEAVVAGIFDDIWQMDNQEILRVDLPRRRAPNRQRYSRSEAQRDKAVA